MACYNSNVIVDFHTHILPPRLIEKREELVKKDPRFAEIYSNPKAKLATVDDLISSMDKDGIDLSVVLNFGWSSPELCHETNDYIMEAVSRYPDRLVGFCTIQPKSEEAIAELERCIQGGIRGLGELRIEVQTLANKEIMSPIVKIAEQKGLIFLTHTSEPVGHSYPGKGDLTPEVIFRFITDFPNLCLVCAHWGGGLPFYALMPEVAEALKNVFFDTAASPFLYKNEVFNQVAQLVGADKILFGSDYPLITQSRIVRVVQQREDLSPEVKAAILGENARRLLNLNPR